MARPTVPTEFSGSTLTPGFSSRSIRFRFLNCDTGPQFRRTMTSLADICSSAIPPVCWSRASSLVESARYSMR